MNVPSIQISNRMVFTVGLLVMFLLLSDSSFASSTSGGGLPFDNWLTKIRNSITGPVAFTVSIFALVGAGSALIFGGDMNGFMRTLIFLVLVLSFVIAAQNTLSAITGKGAQIVASQTSYQIRSA